MTGCLERRFRINPDKVSDAGDYSHQVIGILNRLPNRPRSWWSAVKSSLSIISSCPPGRARPHTPRISTHAKAGQLRVTKYNACVSCVWEVKCDRALGQSFGTYSIMTVYFPYYLFEMTLALANQWPLELHPRCMRHAYHRCIPCHRPPRLTRTRSVYCGKLAVRSPFSCYTTC